MICWFYIFFPLNSVEVLNFLVIINNIIFSSKSFCYNFYLYITKDVWCVLEKQTEIIWWTQGLSRYLPGKKAFFVVPNKHGSVTCLICRESVTLICIVGIPAVTVLFYICYCGPRVSWKTQMWPATEQGWVWLY
jgi:hypothetical protein